MERIILHIDMNYFFAQVLLVEALKSGKYGTTCGKNVENF